MAQEFTAKFKVDISDLKKNINEATKSIKQANAIFKSQTAGMDKWSDSADGLSKKLTQLERVLGEQKKILAAYEEQLKRQQKAYIESGKAVEEAKKKLQDLAENGVAKTDEEYKRYEVQLKEAIQAQTRTGKACDDLRMNILDQKTAIGQTEVQIRKYSDAQAKVERESKSLSSTIKKQQTGLSDLKRKYAEIVAAEGKNSTSAKTLAKQIKSLSGELKDNKKTFSDAEKEADRYDKTLNKTGKSADSLASKLANGLKKGLALVAAGVAAAGAGATALVKEAVSAYGSYEQLVGGVETLFKEGAGKVQEYASVAFKTAGLSANEYMETVTSFSASLIQSLGGDTEKAAELANQAIIDMSDNANKMGTDISSIQYAYQGFAKQNYTMLDNLKLGYGGTKSEMERLIEDANKLREANGEAANLTIGKFSDVVTAIHLIQEQLGIANTTAIEAEGTIQGSANSLKAAWENVLVGISDNTKDFGALVDQLIDSVLTSMKNLLPRIKTALQGIGKLLVNFTKTVLPAVIKEGTPVIMEIITELFSAVSVVFSDVVPDLLTRFLKAVVSYGPKFITGLVDFVKGVADWLENNLSPFVGLVVEALNVIIQALLENTPELLTAVVRIILAVVNAINENLPTIIENILALLPEIVVAIIESLPILIKGLVQLVAGLVQALPEILKGFWEGFKKAFAREAVNKIQDAGRNVVDWFKQVFTPIADANSALMQKMREIGSRILEGLKQGIIDSATKVVDAAKKVVNKVVDGVKNLLGIHSPSTVFEGIGENMALGLEEGFAGSMRSVKGEISQLTGSLATGGNYTAMAANGQIRGATTNFTQIINAPKAPSRIELYRQTQNLLSFAGGV